MDPVFQVGPGLPAEFNLRSIHGEETNSAVGASTMSAIRRSADAWRFSGRPALRSSTTVTAWPCDDRRSWRWEPMKPAPPVSRILTRDRIVVETEFERSRWLPLVGLAPQGWGRTIAETQPRCPATRIPAGVPRAPPPPRPRPPKDCGCHPGWPRSRLKPRLMPWTPGSLLSLSLCFDDTDVHCQCSRRKSGSRIDPLRSVRGHSGVTARSAGSPRGARFRRSVLDCQRRSHPGRRSTTPRTPPQRLPLHRCPTGGSV